MTRSALIDNDIVIKCSIFDFAIWNPKYVSCDVSFSTLASTKFVTSKLMARKYKNLADFDGAVSRLNTFFTSINDLEPTLDEIQLAAKFESVAQRDGLFFDVGEALLVAILLTRDFHFLITGDKRAIASLPKLALSFDLLDKTLKKFVCFEELIRKIIQIRKYGEIQEKVCSEANVDSGLAIIFQCVSPSPNLSEAILGLESNIRFLSATAQEYLLSEIDFLAASP